MRKRAVSCRWKREMAVFKILLRLATMLCCLSFPKLMKKLIKKWKKRKEIFMIIRFLRLLT